MSTSSKLGSITDYETWTSGSDSLAVIKRLFSEGLMTSSAVEAIGKVNISFLLHLLRREAESVTQSMGHAQESLRAVNEKTVADLALEADFVVDEQRLACSLPATKPGSASIGGDRTYGKRTTFLKCWNCIHRSGALRSGVSCGLLQELDERQVAPLSSSCVITSTMNDDGLRKVSKALQDKCDAYRKDRTRIASIMRALKDARYRAPDVAQFFEFRYKESFKYGDRVYVYGNSQEFIKKAQGKWTPGTILALEDQTVFIRLDVPHLSPKEVHMNSRDSRKDRQYIHITSLQTPFVVPIADFWNLTERPEDDVVRRIWFHNLHDSHYRQWIVDHRNGPVFVTLRAFRQSFRREKAFPETVRNRLMSAVEALSILKLTEMPTTPEQVVDAYRSFREKTDELAMAKDTLLLRFYGSKSLHGGGL